MQCHARRVDVLYRERLAPPWTWWLLSVAGAGTVGWVVYVATGPVPAVVTGVIAVVVLAGALVALGRTWVTVTEDAAGGLLTAGRSRLELTAVGRASALDRDRTRLLRGPAFDPLAHHVLRGWSPSAVRLDLADPRDPTPYWFVSCSAPELVVAAVARARGAVDD